VDFFSEARDLFVNIFQIHGPNCKFLDCGLILEKTEGPTCKMSKIRISRNYFPKGNPWTTVTVSEEARQRTAGTASPCAEPHRG
jgi:hypothetical protein